MGNVLFRKVWVIAVLLVVATIILLPLAYAEVYVQLEPYKKVNVTVKKRTPPQVEQIKNSDVDNPDSGIYRQNAKQLKPGEEAMIKLERYKDEPEEERHSQFILFTHNTTDASVELLPGTYKIDGQLILQENVTIEPDERTYCIGLSGGDPKLIESKVKSMATSASVSALGSYAGLWSFGPAGLYMSAVLVLAQLMFDCVGVEKEITVPEKPFSFKPAPVGGAFGNVTITDDLLENASEITFYVLYFPPPTIVDELAVTSNYRNISRMYPETIQPVKN